MIKIKTIVIATATALVLATTVISNAVACPNDGVKPFDPSCGAVGFKETKKADASAGSSAGFKAKQPYYPVPYNPGGVGFKPKK